jgi:tryptophan halogenase
MRATDASYKMSIKFNDFYDVDSGGFHYPFRAPHIYDTQNGLSDWLEIKAFYPEIPNEDFVRCYFPHAALFENNKYTLNNDGAFGVWNPKSDVAYHMDATKFGSWLRDKYCLPLGVVLLRTEVENASMSEDGISHLILSNGDTISADLYVDCTGFKSLLLGGYLKEPFTSYSDILPNNRSWAAQIQYEDKEKELEGFTNCTALKNGWAWNTPLWSRLGTGYVYSDKYISPEDAKEEFKQYLMSNKMAVPRTREQVDSLTYKDVHIKVGIHERTWVKNVVAIGLSAGFIEPLESNGLFTVHNFLYHLVRALERGKVSQWSKDVYNKSTYLEYFVFVEFIRMHYALSVRTDTKYWKSNFNRSYDFDNYKPMEKELSHLHNLVVAKTQTYKTFPVGGVSIISSGLNYPTLDRPPILIGELNNRMNYKTDLTEKFLHLDLRRLSWEKEALKSPTLYEFLKKEYYSD